MRLQYLFTALFVTRSFADLTCRDFVPHNWTSPLVRLFLQDDDSFNPDNHDPKTIPANLTVITNTLTLAPKKSSGSVFRMRVCTSNSLGLRNSDQLYCQPPDRNKKRQDDGCNDNCYRSFSNNLQIIDTATGYCFTWQQQTTRLAYYNFVPCNPNPTNTSQIITSYRGYTYNVNEFYEPASVCDWGEEFYMYQTAQQPYNATKGGWFQAWELASNNRTVVSKRTLPNELNVYAMHHNPLTTYQK